MALTSVDKHLIRKGQNKNGIFRLRNKSLPLINREKLGQQFLARLRRDREKFLDSKRSLSQEEFKEIASDVIKKTYYETIAENDLETALALEEDVERETFRLYEEWLQRDIDAFLNEDPEIDDDVLCPVCCKQCYKISDAFIKCDECRVSLPLTNPIDALRANINGSLAEHNTACRHRANFSYLPDSGGRHNLLILCDVCFYMNLLL